MTSATELTCWSMDLAKISFEAGLADAVEYTQGRDAAAGSLSARSLYFEPLKTSDDTAGGNQSGGSNQRYCVPGPALFARPVIWQSNTHRDDVSRRAGFLLGSQVLLGRSDRNDGRIRRNLRGLSPSVSREPAVLGRVANGHVEGASPYQGLAGRQGSPPPPKR